MVIICATIFTTYFSCFAFTMMKFQATETNIQLLNHFPLLTNMCILKLVKFFQRMFSSVQILHILGNLIICLFVRSSQDLTDSILFDDKIFHSLFLMFDFFSIKQLPHCVSKWGGNFITKLAKIYLPYIIWSKLLSITADIFHTLLLKFMNDCRLFTGDKWHTCDNNSSSIRSERRYFLSRMSNPRFYHFIRLHCPFVIK